MRNAAQGNPFDDDRDVSNSDPAFGRHFRGRPRREAIAIPPAILLVITGVVLALIPGLPSLQLAPDLVLLLVLPPVIYWDAVKMSWKEFRFNLRPIALLAIGCVVFTTVAVAAAMNWLLGFPGRWGSSWAPLSRLPTRWRPW